MGRSKQTVTSKGRRKKGEVGTHACPRCHGTGRVKNVGRGAKK